MDEGGHRQTDVDWSEARDTDRLTDGLTLFFSWPSSMLSIHPMLCRQAVLVPPPLPRFTGQGSCPPPGRPCIIHHSTRAGSYVRPITRPRRLVGGHLDLWWDGGVLAFYAHMHLSHTLREDGTQVRPPQPRCCIDDDQNYPIFPFLTFLPFPGPDMQHHISFSCESDKRPTSCPMSSETDAAPHPGKEGRYESIGACSARLCFFSPEPAGPNLRCPKSPPLGVALAHTHIHARRFHLGPVCSAIQVF